MVQLSLGDVEDLGLSFEADEDNFGKIESHELKYVSILVSIYDMLLLY